MRKNKVVIGDNQSQEMEPLRTRGSLSLICGRWCTQRILIREEFIAQLLAILLCCSSPIALYQTPDISAVQKLQLHPCDSEVVGNHYTPARCHCKGLWSKTTLFGSIANCLLEIQALYPLILIIRSFNLKSCTVEHQLRSAVQIQANSKPCR